MKPLAIAAIVALVAYDRYTHGGTAAVDPFIVECVQWLRFLVWCAILIFVLRVIWVAIPDRWKQPIQLPPAEQKRARKIHARIGACVGYGFVAFMVLGWALRLLG